MFKKWNSKHWMILIGCMLMQAIPYGFAQNVPPLYMNPLTSEQGFHFNLADVSLMFTIGAVFSAIVSPVAGKFFGKTSTKILALGGIIIATVGFIIQPLANNVYLFWIANMFIQAGCIIFSGLTVPYLIGSWFDGEGRSTAMGIAFSGGSIGNFVLQPVFSGLFNNALKTAGTVDARIDAIKAIFWLIAGLFVVLGVLIVLIFIKDNKNDPTPDQTYGEQMTEVIEEVPAKGCGYEHTKTMAAFWFMGFGMLVVGLNIAAQSAQYNVFFNQIELPTIMQDSVFNAIGSVFAIGCLVGNVMGGILFEKLGVFKSVVIGFIFQAISAGAMVILATTNIHDNSTLATILPFVWALFYGLSVFTYTSGPSVIIQTLFGMKDFGQTVGIFNIFFAAGFAVGAFVFSLIEGHLGWFPAWGSVLAFAVVGYLLMLINIIKVEKLHLAEK